MITLNQQAQTGLITMLVESTASLILFLLMMSFIHLALFRPRRICLFFIVVKPLGAGPGYIHVMELGMKMQSFKTMWPEPLSFSILLVLALAIANGTPACYGFTRSVADNETKTYRNGTLVSTGSGINGTDAGTLWAVGGSSGLFYTVPQEVYEIVACDAKISTTDFDALMNYFSQKYAIW